MRIIMPKLNLILSVVFLLIVLPCLAQEAAPPAKTSTEKRVYRTSMISGEAPLIDGYINESVWDQVAWSTDFTQNQPYDGAEPTQETSFKILYDNKNLYIAYRCHDDDPDKIVRRMSRRDGFEGDWVEINIDSYHDKRTAFSFTASVSGVKGDEFVSNDGNNWDSNWNPIWYLKTSIDSLGWVAEVAIPLSQLRFSKMEEQVWGIQFTRRDFRNESRSLWQYIPRNSGYWVSGFGELHGISNVEPKRQIEIQPYILGQYETFEKQEGNPFADGNDYKFSAGLDGKIGVTNDLTLDFTINPDFGQVEADPAALNLDGYQIFFSERRPFFIENRSLFNYNVSSSDAGGSYDTDNLFYSRRIGASPHRRLGNNPAEDRFVDQPNNTTILGAAKFSGKTQSGFSIGLLESVTQREMAVIRVGDTETVEEIEPLTNYMVARVQQDINEGNTVIGGIFTGVQRDIHTDELDFLHRQAYSGGIDFLHRWKDRAWVFNGRLVFSRVAGSVGAIQNTQNAFEHNFQRPDADHLNYDPEATALAGHGGNLSIAEYKGKWRFQTGVTWRSPGLELNDIGFQLNADEINHYTWGSFQETDPKGMFLSWRVNYNHWLRWDFGGNNLYRAVNSNIHGTWKNFWGAGMGLTYENLDVSNNWLRGGPAFRKPNGFGFWTYISSDSRKPFRFGVDFNYGHGQEVKTRFRGVWPYFTVVPFDALNISLGPSWEGYQREDQYVSTESYEGENIYVISAIEQQTISMQIRVNFNLTPDLTIQYYGQPFVSRGRYSAFKKVLDPLAPGRDERFVDYTDQQINFEDGVYNVDQDKDGIVDYSFGDPDFNFMQFRSNMVARWEYKPGSELFLVWSQGANNSGDPEKGLFPSLSEDLLGQQIYNTFLVKFTYRFLN
ncbi:MAG: carbohydrate binding family 9 domain-containing protein [Bacteroidetes bacterium]|nr:carbohydrate binding family 9 domain-containing protein [Bacteroidota bacterium]